MSGKLKLLVVPLLTGTALISVGPGAAQASDADILKQCMTARAAESNQEIVRSECMWKHWEQMASWGP